MVVVPESLDGLMLAYSIDGELWLWSKGTAQPIGAQGLAYSPRLSVDGRLIAFLRPLDDYQVELWAISADGTSERRLAGAAELEPIAGAERDPNSLAIIPHRYQWLPGSHILVFNTEYAYLGPGTRLLDDLNMLDVDTGRITYLLQPGRGGEFYLSPLADQVAITTPNEIILVNLDGSDWRSISSFEAVITYSDYRYYPAPVWSADGDFLLLALPPVDPLAEPAEPTRIYRIEAASSSIAQIGQVTTVPYFDTPVQFPARLDRIAYLVSQTVTGPSSRALYTANVDGSAPRLIFEAELLQFLGWNAVGGSFGFSVGDDQVLYIGSDEATPGMVQPPLPGILGAEWVDEDLYLYYQGLGEQYNLGLADLDGRITVIASSVGSRLEFDFTWVR